MCCCTPLHKIHKIIKMLQRELTPVKDCTLVRAAPILVCLLWLREGAASADAETLVTAR
jgi:hypothetical protein